MTENIKSNNQANDWISDLVGALTDPVICHPQWMEKPPEKIQSVITLQRLIENMAAIKEKRTPLGTDAECSWYLSSTSLVTPLPSEWVHICLYVFNKTCQLTNTEVPADLRQDSLDSHEMGLLNNLKSWIYKVRTEYRMDKERNEKREQKEKDKQEKADLQPKMFQF